MLKQFIKFFIRLLPNTAMVPILFGPNRGFFWTIGSGINQAWLGTYEWEKQLVLAETVKRGKVVFDIGAHAGFYSLLFSRCTGPQGKVVSFEPNPRNLIYLANHLKKNRRKNVQIFPIALSARSGFHPFDFSHSPYTGHLSAQPQLTMIRTETLDSMVFQNNLTEPGVIKIDVEGAELEVLQGGDQVLKVCRPVVFVAIDNRERQNELIDFLQKRQYLIRPICGNPFEIICIPE